MLAQAGRTYSGWTEAAIPRTSAQSKYIGKPWKRELTSDVGITLASVALARLFPPKALTHDETFSREA